MDPNPADAPPGCLVVLIPLSGGMAEDARVWLAHRLTVDGEPEIRDLPRGFVARFFTDELLDGLVNALAAGYPVPLEAAVLGYSAGDDGKLKLESLLQDGNADRRFVSLADIAATPVESRMPEGDPRKWTRAQTGEGVAPAAAALDEVYRLVSMWLTGRFTARPPVVIHCTDGEGLDEHYSRTARSLALLTTAYGPVRLLHYGFAAGVEPTLSGLWPEAAPEPWSGLLGLSAELPIEPEGRPARRALSVNDWTIVDAWSAIFDLVPSVETSSWITPDGRRFALQPRELWAQKMGNKPEEWEDAFACDPAAGVAVVADGASSGIYCRSWADQLTKRFIADRPDARDFIGFAKWVHALRGEWRTAINYPTLNWAKQRKVDEVGAAATLLALELGLADADGNHPWRASAVGDATLFWVRGGRLWASFPVTAADQFGSAPLLIRSNPGFKTQALIASGICQPGDRFLLATDAVAARLLKSAASGPGPEWERFETIAEDAWRQELDALRRSHDMVNDDCTLITLQVAGLESLASEKSAPVAPDTVQPEPAAPNAEPSSPRATEEPAPRPNDDAPVEEMQRGPEPSPQFEQPGARDGFPESTDQTTV